MKQNQITQKNVTNNNVYNCTDKIIHITFSLVILIDKYQIKSAHKMLLNHKMYDCFTAESYMLGFTPEDVCLL